MMKAKNMKKAKLTIIILNHNTKALLADCLDSIKKNNDDISLQVIVSDNSSTDGSVEMIKKNYKWVELLQGPNISFSNGNNRARKYTKGEYILFLNSDTIVHKDTLTKCVEYLDKHNDVGALTCKLVLPDGSLDKDARRRFPTPSIYLNAFIFNNKDRYWYQDIPANITHEVEVIQGAFFLTTKKILDQVGWLDEKYIFDGEDLDLSFQIKKAGYKVVYYPDVAVTHIKKASKNNFSGVTRKMQGVDSLMRFHTKNMSQQYSFVINCLVLIGLIFLKLLRFIKAITYK